jgi:hypothetical protein
MMYFLKLNSYLIIYLFQKVKILKCSVKFLFYRVLPNFIGSLQFVNTLNIEDISLFGSLVKKFTKPFAYVWFIFIIRVYSKFCILHSFRDGRTHIHALWFDIYTGEVHCFSRKEKVSACSFHLMHYTYLSSSF